MYYIKYIAICKVVEGIYAIRTLKSNNSSDTRIQTYNKLYGFQKYVIVSQVP